MIAIGFFEILMNIHIAYFLMSAANNYLIAHKA